MHLCGNTEAALNANSRRGRDCFVPSCRVEEMAKHVTTRGCAERAQAIELPRNYLILQSVALDDPTAIKLLCNWQVLYKL